MPAWRDAACERSVTICLPWLLLLLVLPDDGDALGWEDSSIEVQRNAHSQWQPMIVDEDGDSRQPIASLTDALAVGLVGSDARLVAAAPLFIAMVGVGSPRQAMMLGVDTTSGTTWLMEHNAQAYEAELTDVGLYSSLRSHTAEGVAAAELRPRVRVPLAATEQVPQGELLGRIITDDLEVAGVVIHRQQFVLAQRVPDAAHAWHVAGILGLGVQSFAIEPLVDTWLSDWLAADDPSLKWVSRGGHIPEVEDERGGMARPVITLRPTLQLSNHSLARPRMQLRLGLGAPRAASWVPLLRSAGWAFYGQVSIIGLSARDDDRDNEGWEQANLPRHWAADLLVDSTSPFLGVPAQHFATFVITLLPASLVRLCWWHDQDLTAALQVQCPCFAVAVSNKVRISADGITLDLGVSELFQADHLEEVCTVLIAPLANTNGKGVWRLGEPFLRRCSVSLDYTRRKLGFSPASLPVENKVKDHVQSPHTSPPTELASEHDTGVFLSPFKAFVLVCLLVAALVFICRKVGGSARMVTTSIPVQWQNVPTDDPGSPGSFEDDGLSEEFERPAE